MNAILSAVGTEYRFLAVVFFVLIPPQAAIADKADVLDADIRHEGDSRYTFSVTVSHTDTGWDHYVDRWEILTMDDQVFTGRVLRHPHVNEPSFTRSLHFISVPDEIDRVRIRAHCSRDGFGGKTLEIQLPKSD